LANLEQRLEHVEPAPLIQFRFVDESDYAKIGAATQEALGPTSRRLNARKASHVR
jgi:hypothetical protein